MTMMMMPGTAGSGMALPLSTEYALCTAQEHAMEVYHDDSLLAGDDAIYKQRPLVSDSMSMSVCSSCLSAAWLDQIDNVHVTLAYSVASHVAYWLVNVKKSHCTVLVDGTIYGLLCCLAVYVYQLVLKRIKYSNNRVHQNLLQKCQPNNRTVQKQFTMQCFLAQDIKINSACTFSAFCIQALVKTLHIKISHYWG